MSDGTIKINLAPQFSTLLTILFIGLKLGKVIDWSWWWVLCPIWIGLAIILAVGFIVLIGYVAYKMFN